MSRLEAWLAHAATLLVGGTGLVYAWMRYLLPPADPYAVVGHPLQPAVQHLHILSAPLLVFAAGVIWRRHVWCQWRCSGGEGRRSGAALLAALVPMVASGYLIQTAAAEAWRTAWVAVHLVASALWLAGYAAHQVVRAREGGEGELAGGGPSPPERRPGPAPQRIRSCDQR